MARPFGRRATETAPRRATPKVLRADGRRIDLTSRDTGTMLAASRQGWQQTAFAYRDAIGELRYANRLLSRSVARTRFYVAEVRPWPNDPVPLEGDDHELDRQLAADAITNFDQIPFDTNPDGFTARLVENLEVAGEGWVHIDATGRFHVRSVSEISVSPNGRVTISGLPNASQAATRELDPAREDLLRCWVPHPEWAELADSPMRSLLEVCEDVVLAGREQRAAARSRVAANGFLLIPQSATLLKARGDEDTDDITDDDFTADLTAAMLAPIRDDGDAQAVVPIVLQMDPEDIQHVKHLRVDREDSEQLIERQQTAILRLLKGLDIQPEQVEGVAGLNHWCVDDETQVLTIRGWVGHTDLEVGDIALTLNHDTGLSEWQPVLDIYRADVVDEPMVSMETRTHSSLTTLAHRWPVIRKIGGKNRNAAGEIVDTRRRVRQWTTSDGLSNRDWIPTAAPSADRPAEAKYTDDLVELVGWFWTEGNIGNSGVSIAQSHTKNGHRVDRIRAALTRLYGAPVDSLVEVGRPAWREKIQLNTSSFGGPITVFYLNDDAAEPLHDAAPHKLVSRDFVMALTPAQLELFIDISAQGDGWHYRSGRLDMWQRDPAALDGYELALILSGRMVTRGMSDGGHWVSPHGRVHVSPLSACAEATRQGRDAQVTQARYTGVVWCPTTANGSWFARRRGTTYFTGNSSWIIDAQSVKHQVQPMAETVAACLTQAFLRPALESLGHDPAVVERVTIAVDTSPLSENPNRGQDARDAHAALVISDATMREALGFDEDDAPDEREYLRRLAASGRLSVGDSAMVLGLPQRQQSPVTVPGETVPVHELPAGETRVIGEGETAPARPVPDTRPEPSDQPAVTAAADPAEDRWVVDVDTARRLVDIDAVLAERIIVAADAAVARMVEKAGARVRSQAQKDRALAASLVGVEAHLVPGIIGREQVESFAPISDLLADGYQRLRGQFVRWLADAAVQVADVLLELLRIPARDPRAKTVRDTVTSRVKANTEAAWQLMVEVLDEAAEQAMFEPDPFNPAPPERGEASGTVVAPADVRRVLAAAGGAPPSGDPGAGGVGTGPVAREVMADHGAVLLGWEWQYRPEILRRHPFLPHVRLNGRRFATWTDPRLDTDGETAWLGPYFHPGDHRGCACSAVPVYALPELDDGIVAQRLREAAGDPRNLLAAEIAAQDETAGRVGTSLQNEVEVRDRITKAIERLQRDHIERGGS